MNEPSPERQSFGHLELTLNQLLSTIELAVTRPSQREGFITSLIDELRIHIDGQFLNIIDPTTPEEKRTSDAMGLLLEALYNARPDPVIRLEFNE